MECMYHLIFFLWVIPYVGQKAFRRTWVPTKSRKMFKIRISAGNFSLYHSLKTVGLITWVFPHRSNFTQMSYTMSFPVKTHMSTVALLQSSVKDWAQYLNHHIFHGTLNGTGSITAWRIWIFLWCWFLPSSALHIQHAAPLYLCFLVKGLALFHYIFSFHSSKLKQRH